MNFMFLFAFTGTNIFLIVLAAIALIGGIWWLSVYNRFHRYETTLDGLVQTRTALLSQITTTIEQSVQVVQEGAEFAKKITATIIGGRVAGPTELLRALTEAQIPIDADLFSNFLPTIEGLWSRLTEKETSIQSMLVERNTMLVTIPDKWFITGDNREIPPIVTKAVSDMAASGVLDIKPLFQ